MAQLVLPNAQLLVVEDGNGSPSQESADGAISTTVHHSMRFEHLVHHAISWCAYIRTVRTVFDNIYYVHGVNLSIDTLVAKFCNLAS